MQLIQLELKNFLSYRQASLNFENFHVVALVGKNGSGKSSLLDAITFSLFGRARGVNKGGVGHDKLLNINAKGEEMQVSLTFSLNNLTYRVTRRRDFSKKTTPMRLFFHILNPVSNSEKDLSENTPTITQRKIEQYLKMDYSTFTASSNFLILSFFNL